MIPLLLALALQRNYWPLPLDSLAIGHDHQHTHVAVVGVVAPKYPIAETDGDLHIKLLSPNGSGRFIVAECIPKLPCAKPKAGQKITVYGISRRDSEHGWYEVHPVESWTPAP
jgi:hypothetical protein